MGFKAQIVACSATALTISDTVHNRASADKAGYGSWQAANMVGTFKVTFPDTIFKKLTNKDAATHAGFGFQPAFGSQTVGWRAHLCSQKRVFYLRTLVLYLHFSPTAAKSWNSFDTGFRIARKF